MVAAVASTTSFALPSPAPAQVASVQSDRQLGDRAMDVLRALSIDIGSRPAGTDAERQAAAYLGNQYRDMGYAVSVEPFDFDVRSSSGTSQDVEARNPNEDPNAPLVIVGGHYDSVPAGPGANDNGSGTATVVEVARELSWDPVSGVAVRYVAFGAEEIGLLGSAAYVRNLSATDRSRIKVVLNLDMLAVGDEPQFAGSEPWLSEAMARAASQGYAPRDATAELRNLSDHQSFINAGIPALLFHEEVDDAYHTARDVAARVQPDSMNLMGAIAIGLIRLAAS
jgi:Zn-dependent M28 family amino/carboxypeptidase